MLELASKRSSTPHCFVVTGRVVTGGRVALLAVLVLSLALAGSFASSAHAGRESERELTQDERDSLAAGDLVRRPMTQRRGDLQLMGGTSYQVIEAPPRVVWSALLDTQRYPRMMPQVREARVVRTQDSERTVFMRQGAGPIDTSYYLKINVYQERGDITFAIDERRPHDLRAAWGFYTVRPYGKGEKTLLAYGVMADIGGGVFGSMVRSSVHEWMLKVPWTVKRFVEGSGRHIYKAQWQKPAAGTAKNASAPHVASSQP
jgi:ribosome-associated toxin RatA of RatAB toxin-antitoxin module